MSVSGQGKRIFCRSERSEESNGIPRAFRGDSSAEAPHDMATQFLDGGRMEVEKRDKRIYERGTS